MGSIGKMFGQQGSMSGINRAAGAASSAQEQAQGTLGALQPAQREFGQALADQALGRAPSLAEAQLRAAQDRNLAQQLAAAKSARGGNAALQSRNLMNAGMQQGQQTAQAAALARMQEQQQQQGAFANYLANQQGYNANLLGARTTAESNRAGLSQRQAEVNNTLGMNILSGVAQGIAKLPTSGGSAPTGMNQGGMVPYQQQPTGGQNLFDQYMQAPVGDEAQQKGAAGFAGAIKDIMNKPQASGGSMPIVGNAMPAMQTMVMNDGGSVPGKPVVKGDSPKNDTVPAMLSPGEVVVPRTVVDAGPEASAKFVEATKSGAKVDPKKFLQALQASAQKTNAEAGKEPKTEKPDSFGAILAAQKELNDKLSTIERKYGKKG